jgi:uncharacterized protein (TIGR03435 family)
MTLPSRIPRIMPKHLLALAAFAAATFPIRAQSPPAPVQTLADTWQGTLKAGGDLRIVLKITSDDGIYKSVFYSIDQGPGSIPVKSTTLQGSAVKMDVSNIGGVYEGKLSADNNTIDGTWTQGDKPLPLLLTRATPETAWAIPEPPPQLPPMAAGFDPTFEVATIKPSKPDQQGKGFGVRGRRFSTFNTNLADLISFAYGVHAKQIIGAPAWYTEDKYDIAAQPNGEGAPSDKQWKSMLQKLLAERFQLTFHSDKKELAVYVLTVVKTGSRLTKSDGDPDGLPGNFFTALGKMNNTNSTVGDFTRTMQAAVMDRPVVDQTRITGRYNFTLNWTPDDSQFGGMGAKVPPPTDAANAPPDLYKAIQDQLGLKLEPTKAQADVLVIDHVDKPSAN